MTNVYSFTRVEPVCRGGDPGWGLAATVQDPFWILARQNQFGELGGEDAGSPVQVTLVQNEVRLDQWTPLGGAALPYSPDHDVLEAVVAGEAAGPAHSILDRVEAGRALAAAVPLAIADRLRASFPITLPLDAPRLLVRAAPLFGDGLAIAGALLAGAKDTNAELGAALSLPEEEVASTRDDLMSFACWCSVTFGTGPNSWIPERLERRFQLGAAGVSLLVAPGHTGERVTWSDFDFIDEAALPTGTSTTRARIPTTVQFPGQPRSRFWEFEDTILALSRIDAATTDLGRLALVEFSTIYGNDWFTFPIPVTYGSIQSISDLVVRDTFGANELIAPAADEQWTMYRATGSSTQPPTLVIPSVTAAPLAGDVVEEVRFLRDEMANLIWGIEEIVTDGDGTRRDLVDEYVLVATQGGPVPPNVAVSYRLMTDVPEHWVPFIPVRLSGGSRQVGLVEAVVPRLHSLGDVTTSAPRSSVLQELRGSVIPEEEVPSAGVVVRRRWFLARSADGGRYAWAARSVSVGRGEGASGLRFDVAESANG